MARHFRVPVWAEGLGSRPMVVILVLTLARVVFAVLDRTELSTDEAQYWVWGQSLDFGAYSKPPLIGWLIGASTSILGDSVMAVRLPAALCHGATALGLYMAALRLGSARVAGLAALVYLTLPAVTLGSALMTTDTPMLLAAASALLLQLRLAEAREMARPWADMAAGMALLFGVVLGLGLLAKHAMLFWLAEAVLAGAVSARFRLRATDLALAGAAMLVVVTPHLIWLARHDFVTLHHVEAITAGAGAGVGAGLSLLRPLRFLAEQAVVLGPVVFLALVVAARGWWRDPAARGLTMLMLVPLGIVLAQAVRGPVLANWAALALLPGSVLAARWLEGQAGLRRLALGLGLAVALALPVAKVIGAGVPGPGGQPLLARYLGHAPVAGWALAEAQGGGTLIATERGLLADLAWFSRGAGPALRALPPMGFPANHWEATAPFRPANDPGPVLLLWPQGKALPCGRGSEVSQFTAPPGAYGGRVLVLWRLEDPGCLANAGARDG